MSSFLLRCGWVPIVLSFADAACGFFFYSFCLADSHSIIEWGGQKKDLAGFHPLLVVFHFCGLRTFGQSGGQVKYLKCLYGLCIFSIAIV